MIDSLAAAVTVASILAAVVVLVTAVRGTFRWRVALPALIGFEVVLVLQAVLAVVGLLGGHHAREPAVLVAYLAVSVLVLPATVAQARGEDGRWGAVLVAVGLAVVAVVVVRAETTWRPW